MSEPMDKPVFLIRLDPGRQGRKLILFGLYMISIFAAYVLILSPMYTYSLLTYKPNYLKLGISTVMVLLSMMSLPADYDKPSTYLYFICYTLTYLPTAAYYWMNDQPTAYFLFETVCIMLIPAILKIPLKRFSLKAKTATIIFRAVFIFYVAACAYLVWANGGLHLSGLLSDLYQVRSENSFSGLSGYVLNWCAKSFMPLFMVYFWLKRKWTGVLLTAFLQLALFASYGFKAFILAVVMLAGVSYLMKKPEQFRRNWLRILILGNVACLILALAGINTPIQIFTYRTFVLPAQGQFEYYDYFTHHDFLIFSEGSIGRLFGVKYPYAESIGRIVNLYIYKGMKISNGNTGAFSYGFADLGFAGMLLAAGALGLIFLIADCGTENLPKMVTVGAMAYQVFILNDNNILIGLNTGGILWTLILLALLNSVFQADPRSELATEFGLRDLIIYKE